MEISIHIPDDLARSLGQAGGDLSRRTLEALAIDGYRRGSLNQLQVGQLLGLSRIETEDLLARHIALYDYDPAELDREARALEKLSDRTPKL
jgi:predicted HTH domain antitoxin